MTDAWRRVPAWARWPVAYAALASASALVGWLTVGVGQAMFVAGALAILVSAALIRTGGQTRLRVVRSLLGAPVAVEKQDAEDRRGEIAVGVKVFLVGLALWAPLVVLALRG